MSNGDGGMSTVRREYDEPEAVRRTARVISSFCSADQPQCVEAEAQADGYIRVTDSKDQTSDHRAVALVFTKDEWDAFVAGVKNGEFDYEALRSFAHAAAEVGWSARVKPGQIVRETPRADGYASQAV